MIETQIKREREREREIRGGGKGWIENNSSKKLYDGNRMYATSYDIQAPLLRVCY